MFLSLRSPFGGNPLASNWLREEKREKEGIRLEPGDKPTIVNEFYALKLGYCDHCGESMFVSTKTAEFLYKLLYKRFK